jgi:Abortive infection alpha
MTNELITAATNSLTSLTGDIYKDLFRPSTARVGLSLETLIKVALTPVSLLDWGFEQSKEWLQNRIHARIIKTPPEYIVQPTSGIVSAALQRIATSHDTPELRELYAELLLKAMDSRTARDVHPAYFYIVEQLASSEALILISLHNLDKEVLFAETFDDSTYRFMEEPSPSIELQFRSFCNSTLVTEVAHSNIWLKNLCRLGLLELKAYGEAVLKQENGFTSTSAAKINNLEHLSLIFTEFGVDFISACTPIDDAGLRVRPDVEVRRGHNL